jgi:hypothetical protein
MLDVCTKILQYLFHAYRSDIYYVAFNPKPFISTFEAAVDRLITLRKDVQVKTEQMEKDVRVAEREYSKKMSDLNRGFEVRSRRLVVCCKFLMATRP